MSSIFKFLAIVVVLVAAVLGAIRKFMTSTSEPVVVDPSGAPFTVRQAKEIVDLALEHDDRACFLVPTFPARRTYVSTSRPSPPVVAPDMRRPTVQDLIDARILKRDIDLKNMNGEIFAVETAAFRTQPPGFYASHGGERSRLCFARVKLGKVLGVAKGDAAPGHLVVRYTLEVVEVDDWVRELPDEVVAQARPWLGPRVVEARLHLCSRGGGFVSGTSCPGVPVDDEPLRLMPTGPQPDDGLGPWLSPGMRGYGPRP